MSNSAVNSGFAKCFILFMAIVILVQGGGYLGLAIWGITHENCDEQTTDALEKPFDFAMDLIYFTNSDCPPKVSIGNSLPELSITIDWDKSTEITDRLDTLLIVYCVISGLWVLTSLLIICTMCCSITTAINIVCYWPWFLCILAGSILDAVATGFFIHDIVHTTSAEETFDYIGVLNLNEVIKYFESYDIYFVTPAVVMTLISSRVVLVWLLNIIGGIFCISLSSKLASHTSQQKNASNASTARVSVEQRTQVTAQLQQPQFVQPKYVTPAELQQPTPTQAPIVEQYPPQIKPKPLPIFIAPQLQRENSNQPRSYETTPVASSMYPSAPSPDASVNNNDVIKPASIPVVMDVATYRNTESHPDRLNYPVQSTPSPDIQKAPMRQLSVESPLNNRYSASDNLQYAAPQNQNPRVSAELRGQLPWSYTNMMGKPQPPRKPQMQVYPEIPEADYGGQPSSSRVAVEVIQAPAPPPPQSNEGYSRW